MGKTPILVKHYQPQLGLDLSVSDILRDPTKSRDMKNWTKLPNGSIATRWGYQVLNELYQSIGLQSYVLVDSSTGIASEEIVVLGLDTDRGHVYKLTEGSLTVSYTGADATATFTIAPDASTSTYKITLTSDSNTFTTDLDDGFAGGSDTVANLVTWVTSQTDWTASATGTTSGPAAFIPMVISRNAKSAASYTVPFYYNETVTETEVSSAAAADAPFRPLYTAWAASKSEDFKLASFVTFNDSLYIAHSSNHLFKYDGNATFRTGLPTPADCSVATSTGTLNGSYQYFTTYEFTDNQGNLIESEPSAVKSISPATNSVNVTIDQLQPADETFYYYRGAVINGAQSGVNTITVDDGSGGQHNMTVGDKAFFFDVSTSADTERTVTAVSATTITVDGDAVDVGDNAPLSAGIRQRIYRTKAGGSLFYFAAAIPNNPFAATHVHNDDLSDSNLGAQYVTPVTGAEHTQPPSNCGIVESFAGLLLLSGDPNNPDRVYFSDVDSAEYFPALNFFDVRGRRGDKVTGLGVAERFFLVLKTNSCHRVVGTLTKSDFTVSELSNSVGCIAQSTVAEVAYGGFSHLIWVNENGVYQSTEGNAPVEISGDIRAVFDEYKQTNSSNLVLELAVGFNDTTKKQYLLNIPIDDNTSTTEYVFTSSKTYVFDYGRTDLGERPQWYEWDTQNLFGGAAVFNNKLVWAGYEENQAAHVVCQRTDRDDSYTAFDHVDAIASHVEFGAEDLDEPGIYKKWLRNRFYSLNQSQINNFSILVQTYLDYSSDLFAEFTSRFTATDRTPRFKLKPAKAQALAYRIEHSTAGERPIIDGIETEIVVAHLPKMKKAGYRSDS